MAKFRRQEILVTFFRNVFPVCLLSMEQVRDLPYWVVVVSHNAACQMFHKRSISMAKFRRQEILVTFPLTYYRYGCHLIDQVRGDVPYWVVVVSHNAPYHHPDIPPSWELELS
jgi:hypothetical protein